MDKLIKQGSIIITIALIIMGIMVLSAYREPFDRQDEFPRNDKYDSKIVYDDYFWNEYESPEDSTREYLERVDVYNSKAYEEAGKMIYFYQIGIGEITDTCIKINSHEKLSRLMNLMRDNDSHGLFEFMGSNLNSIQDEYPEYEGHVDYTLSLYDELGYCLQEKLEKYG